MEKELLEQMAEKVHDAWWEEKKEQGYHHPDDCNAKIILSPPISRYGTCNWCHKDMKPYAELDDKTKNLDRVMVMKFEAQLEELGMCISEFPTYGKSPLVSLMEESIDRYFCKDLRCQNRDRPESREKIAKFVIKEASNK